MLPRKLKNNLFDKLSGVTMRPFFTPISAKDATGLQAWVLQQSERDFFVNGTITSHASCPQLMAGLWSGGREAALVDDHLPAWLKKAMGAALSQENRCAYCEDMLLSLTHGAKEDAVADGIRMQDAERIVRPDIRAKLDWTRAALEASDPRLRAPLFSRNEMPEAVATVLTFSYTNKISDYTMDGSPVPNLARGAALKAFGIELTESAAMRLEPGASLDMLPEAELAADLNWARGNERVADSLARWASVIEQQISDVLAPSTQAHIHARLAEWRGGHPPLSRSWVEGDLEGLVGLQKDLARVAILVAKASYQIDNGLLEGLVKQDVSEADLVKLGAFGAFSGARRVAAWTADAFVPLDTMAPEASPFGPIRQPSSQPGNLPSDATGGETVASTAN